MPEHMTDEQIKDIFSPKLQRFMDERLTADNAKRIYNFLKPYHYDTDGWILYDAAKDILKTDVYSEFPAEDNMGYFETLDGYGLLKWLEIAKFADKDYEQLPGGYELLRSHTLDTESPKYQAFQNELWTAAMKNIIDRLAEKQPYLLEGFWNRLSYIENILGKGFPTRDDLNAKIEREAKTVYDAATIDDLTSFHSEVEIKTKLRNELCEIAMTGEMVEALWVKDDVLEDAYRFYLEDDKDSSVFVLMCDFLEKAEHDYLADRVFDRAKLEYEDYIDRVKEMPKDKIIDEAYKLTILYDLYISLEPETSNYGTERLRALRSLASPLWSLYDEWQRRDFSHMDDIKDVILETADRAIEENEEQGLEDAAEYEDEDEQEI